MNANGRDEINCSWLSMYIQHRLSELDALKIYTEHGTVKQKMATLTIVKGYNRKIRALFPIGTQDTVQ